MQQGWARFYARMLSIPAVTLLTIASTVAILSKFSIAAASEDVPHSVRAPELARIEQASFTVVFEGIASFYAHAFHGRRTAQGKRFNMHEFTAAHRTLPFGTILRVTNPSTGECVLVQINDRGPFVKRRVLDLSLASARALGIGLGKVRAEGFTPADIANDSAVLVFFGDRYQPYRVPPSGYEVVETFDSFTHAVRAHRLHIYDSNIGLAIIPQNTGTGEQQFTYALVRLSPLVQWSDTIASVLPSP
ncbi:MAG: septal ring lytic transglycosylase RlpA family protein [Candidatus Kapabacteria bacterium]|nr:septal ring lytic transglycosylase RlpA family protein [Candidatus Kapabacteria bacterium]